MNRRLTETVKGWRPHADTTRPHHTPPFSRLRHKSHALRVDHTPPTFYSGRTALSEGWHTKKERNAHK